MPVPGAVQLWSRHWGLLKDPRDRTQANQQQNDREVLQVRLTTGPIYFIYTLKNIFELVPVHVQLDITVDKMLFYSSMKYSLDCHNCLSNIRQSMSFIWCVCHCDNELSTFAVWDCRYNSGGKSFSEVTSTKHLSVSIDAVVIHNALWKTSTKPTHKKWKHGPQPLKLKSFNQLTHREQQINQHPVKPCIP